MRVRVMFFGGLKEIVGASEDAPEIPPHSTLATLFESYCQRFETLRPRRPSILFARNGEFATPETALADNDEVAFLPPVSGGAGRESVGRSAEDRLSELAIDDPAGHVFRITRRPIDSQSLARTLQRDQDGAVVVFEGVVRDNTKGRPTSHLEYECYEALAIGQMARIGREIAATFPIGRIAIVHRLGRLQIGEASVAVVASAPHRRPAFEAALEGINRLKREVPIWKREFFADGAVWVEGEWDERLLTGFSAHAQP
ncbi:MAG: molybdenum cofactor biosynthesis protein MoaE [Acidobacteriaceae bacterium]|nr:molybdenum cofactor biosynthesis protein MoaE [Acidobacteriaceae bacterium]